MLCSCKNRQPEGFGLSSVAGNYDRLAWDLAKEISAKESELRNFAWCRVIEGMGSNSGRFICSLVFVSRSLLEKDQIARGLPMAYVHVQGEPLIVTGILTDGYLS